MTYAGMGESVRPPFGYATAPSSGSSSTSAKISSSPATAVIASNAANAAVIAIAMRVEPASVSPAKESAGKPALVGEPAASPA